MDGLISINWHYYNLIQSIHVINSPAILIRTERCWWASIAFRFLDTSELDNALLELEVFVSADIINTVALDLAFNSLGVLGLLVIILTFVNEHAYLKSKGGGLGKHPLSVGSEPEAKSHPIEFHYY